MRHPENATDLVAVLKGRIGRNNRAFWISAFASALSVLLLGYSIWDGWEVPG